ncbi:hypothetical protein [Actinomadura livida]|uniref:Uncharacterized protein n=1 Tax=Actinomadura livida TaxID=79909 RepID=A0A7W7I9C5_9ACTN|nr:MULTISPECIES: hypothetical protein [Actinomadura]MBB4772578.1 hypothetical protein [Actinomadura catellatispora]GGU11426.1 hypothetical protein GCM10010208_39900 [Actinomadura livida]
MRLLGRFRRRGTRHAVKPARTGRRVPTFREMHARMRTERAEADLMATEARIHQEAERYRRGMHRAG